MDAQAEVASEDARVSPARFAARIAVVAAEVTLVILLGAGGFKFFYQGF